MPNAASFRVGDRVVYPNHGVGVIEHIRPAEDNGAGFYLLHIEANQLRVMVPLANATSVGLRPVARAAELTVILEYLSGSECLDCSSDWKERFRVHSDKLRQGGLADLAAVLKALVALHQRKPLSFREKKMLDRAALQFSAELAAVEKIKTEAALERLRESLKRAGLTLPPLDE